MLNRLCAQSGISILFLPPVQFQSELILHRVNPFSCRISLIRNHINSRRRNITKNSPSPSAYLPFHRPLVHPSTRWLSVKTLPKLTHTLRICTVYSYFHPRPRSNELIPIHTVELIHGIILPFLLPSGQPKPCIVWHDAFRRRRRCATKTVKSFLRSVATSTFATWKPRVNHSGTPITSLICAWFSSLNIRNKNNPSQSRR